MKTDIGIITDEEIVKSFGNTHTSYSLEEKRELLEDGCLNALAGYVSGHTLTTIMKEMRLINSKNKLLIRGRYFLHLAYRNK